MTLFSMFALAGAMFLLAITPGPAVFATVSRGLGSGFANASFVTFGIVLGNLIYLFLVLFGLSFIAGFLGDIFIVAEYLGGLALIYLGYNILNSKEHETEVKAVKEISLQKNFLTGLITALGNAKAIIFYLGFLSTFMNLTAFTIIDIAIVCSIVTAVLASVMMYYSYTSSGVKKLFNTNKAKKKIHTEPEPNMVTGATSVVIRA